MTMLPGGTAAATAVEPNAMRLPAFRSYLLMRMTAALGIQIISVSVAWMVYEKTRDPFALAMVGLVQFLPTLLLVLVSGQVADRFERSRIVQVCALAELCCGLGLIAWLTSAALSSEVLSIGQLWPVFALLVAFGISRAFFGPASQALMANTAPGAALPSAVSWSTGSWQLITILGPVLGGLLYAAGALVALGAGCLCFVLSALAASRLPRAGETGSGKAPVTASEVLAGLRYVRQNPVVLGAISLDLFIVLLGGATALLPVIALDLLDAGPLALGMLRAAPGVGGIVVAAWLAKHSLKARAGQILFISVTLFGLATLGLGLTREPAFAIAALIVIGASDMISVYVRSSVIQLATPDALRGRVSALNMICIGASNELGEFRAGSVAALLGPAQAILLGGACSVAVAGIWAVLCPALRRIDNLTEVMPSEPGKNGKSG